MEEVMVGRVVKYFPKIMVAAVRIDEGELRIGDRIKIKGHDAEFEQVVESMQVEHRNVERAGKGTDVGIKVKERVRENDRVFLLKG
jgi:putative protease